MKCFIHVAAICSMMTGTALAALPLEGANWSAKCTITKGKQNIIVSTSFPPTMTKDDIIGVSIWQVAKIAKSLSFNAILFKKFECSEIAFAGSSAGGGCFLVATDVSDVGFVKDSKASKKVIVLVNEILLGSRFKNLTTRCSTDTSRVN